MDTFQINQEWQGKIDKSRRVLSEATRATIEKRENALAEAKTEEERMRIQVSFDEANLKLSEDHEATRAAADSEHAEALRKAGR